MSPNLAAIFIFIISSVLALPQSGEEIQHKVKEASQVEKVVATIEKQRDHQLDGEKHHEIAIRKTIRYPTIKCDQIIPDHGTPSTLNHEACATHCITLSPHLFYTHGSCHEGVCHCTRDSTSATEEKHLAKGHPTVRCEHITPGNDKAAANNHQACTAHCATLGHGLVYGECSQGICHCSKAQRSAVLHSHDIVKEVVKCDIHDLKHCLIHCKTLNPLYEEARCVEGVCQCSKSETYYTQLAGVRTVSHPTVRCEHLLSLYTHPSSERHDLCLAHCHTLGIDYTHGKCVRGICHCELRHESHHGQSESHPTVKCEHILPVARIAEEENHEACAAHCHSIGGGYITGSCVEGVCRCKAEMFGKETVI